MNRGQDTYPKSLDELRELINSTLDHCTPRLRVNDLIQYLAKNSRQDPLLAITLLEKMMTKIEPNVFVFAREEVKQVLEAGMESQSAPAKDKAIAAINKFGEWGMYEYRDLLSRN